MAIAAASLLAAAGQILLALGARGNQELSQYFNKTLLAGLFAYGAGTVAWIFALSRLPLSFAYGFTALTFILVYLGSAAILREQLRLWPMIGVALIAVGFVLIAVFGRAEK